VPKQKTSRRPEKRLDKRRKGVYLGGGFGLEKYGSRPKGIAPGVIRGLFFFLDIAV
jgi:hypothetical protein